MDNYIRDPYDEVWMLILLLTEIVEIVIAPVIAKSRKNYLQVLINEYLSMRPGIVRKKNSFRNITIFIAILNLLEYLDR